LQDNAALEGAGVIGVTTSTSEPPAVSTLAFLSSAFAADALAATACAVAHPCPCWICRYLCNNDSCGGFKTPSAASFGWGLGMSLGFLGASSHGEVDARGEAEHCLGYSENDDAGDKGGDLSMADRRPCLLG